MGLFKDSADNKIKVFDERGFVEELGGLQGPPGPQGIQGPAGPQGEPGPVGPAGLNWQGAWSASGTYVVDDAVGYNGASWFCISNVGPTATVPSSDPTKWALLAAQGARGATGATGAQGPTGATGAAGPAGSALYRSYSAIVQYNSSSLTVVSLLENTLGITITWTFPFGRLGTASSPVFTANKTVVIATPFTDFSSAVYINLGNRASDTTINLYCLQGSIFTYPTNTPFFLEIRVYN